MKTFNLILLLLVSSFACANSINSFENITVGIKVTKPTDWQFMTAEESLNNIKRIKLNDSEFHEYMVKHTTAPLVVMTKYPEPYDDLNPSFKINIKPLGQLNGVDPKKILHLFIPQFKKLFQDFKLDQAPMDTTVSGLNASYMRIYYSLKIPDGRVFPTSSELWLVPRGNFFFLLGAGTRQDDKASGKNEITKILNSIVFTK